jgi:NADPH-dependent curcumin reductase CurA
MAERNRRFLLHERPQGRIGPSTFDLVEEDVPQPGEGEALVRTEWISLDPTNRAWLEETPTYLPPVGIGEVMRALGLGRVVASNHPRYAEGQLVQGLTGWQEWVVASDAAPLLPVPDLGDTSPSFALGALGMTGLTAWVGLTDIGKPQPGETVVVSAAAGAVGSVAAQIAKIKGARVVGIAGGPEKCALLTDQLGLDAAVDHRADDWHDQLVEATPDGIDVDFENVGGPIMDHVMMRLNIGARISLCGMIAEYNTYNEGGEHAGGQMNIGQLIMQRATIQGFLVLDYGDRFEEAIGYLAGMLGEGKLHYDETIVEGGIEAAPGALHQLFTGENMGKLLVRLAD